MAVHPLLTEDIEVLRRLADAGGSITPMVEAGRMYAIAYVMRLRLATLSDQTLSLTARGIRIAEQAIREGAQFAMCFDDADGSRLD